ncbi:hypothetical protein [Flavivirga eckloniae]|uniref:Uncharacterized protein n=1 Tax=Flavivirga eckloniae TaxID=1803846 RepID=A0A2K9PPX1_9FLAO|nr:hypothetical protein [Flavivirga eckloniae]AUP79123.1 hypothetical protein C1H87_10595 [Flavivirga eckloniae]
MNNFIYYPSWNVMYIVYGIFAFLLLRLIFSKTLKSYHSKWNTLIDNFEYSPKEFYSRLKTELESHGITKIKIEEVYIKEGGVMSHSRIYLRATWKDYQYDICGAKFGKGFFISWWLLYKDSIVKILISKIPFFGTWLAQKLYPITYFRIDSASMFMTYAQSSVLKVIDDITKNKGVRALTESERKPMLGDIFKR